jgi:hypothetical protein
VEVSHSTWRFKSLRSWDSALEAEAAQQTTVANVFPKVTNLARAFTGMAGRGRAAA